MKRDDTRHIAEPPPPTRVLVVEDSLTMRKRLVEILSEADGLEVVGEAADGREAIALCEQLRPDVVTLDMQLPDVTGLDATEHIMAWCPTPILIVSSSVNRGEVFKTYDALAAGAVDVLEKPRGDEVDGDWERRLVSAVKLVSRIRVITHPRGRLTKRDNISGARSGHGESSGARSGHGESSGARSGHGESSGARSGTGESSSGARSGHGETPSSTPRELATPEIGARRAALVAIGVSTGGPAAMTRLLGALPADFPAPILLVLHISPLFAPALVEWLGTQSPLPVRLAIHGEPLPRQGIVLVAPPDRHLVVRGARLELVDSPERHSCKPSVDVLFESLAGRIDLVACLMTGMGRDGAEGMKRVRRGGGFTIAQDEASSVVFGMPREAIRLDAADRILSLDEFAPTLVALCRAGVPA